MFTTFKNVKFLTEDFAGFEVVDSVLLIFTKNRTLELYFDTHLDAVKAANDLETILTIQKNVNESKASVDSDIFGDLSGLFKNAKSNVLDNVLSKAQGVFGKKEKVKTEVDFYGTLASVLLQSVSNTAQSKLNDVVKDITKSLEEVLDKVSTMDVAPDVKPEAPTSTEKKEPEQRKNPFNTSDLDKKVNIKRNDVFGASTASQAKPSSKSDVPELPKECHVIIGDMTSPQLRSTIDEIVKVLMETDKCKELFDSIRTQFGDDATNSAVEHFKAVIYQKCTENTESTIAEVLTKHFI